MEQKARGKACVLAETEVIRGRYENKPITRKTKRKTKRKRKQCVRPRGRAYGNSWLGLLPQVDRHGVERGTRDERDGSRGSVCYRTGG